MSVTVQEDIVVTGYFCLNEDTKLAKGSKITVKPGGVLDLNSRTLLNFGTIELVGTDSIQATIKNGTYSTESTTGTLRASHSLLDQVVIDGFFSNGTLTLCDSVLTNTRIEFMS
jgi:hypothetical protein